MSANLPVVIVMLRQPNSRPEEARTDPLYEFGCFGLTGCHSENLLRDDAANGARLAFVQGGAAEVRLVYVTPPVRVVNHGRIRSCQWAAKEMPLRYGVAPVLINNAGRSDVSGLTDLIRSVGRSTWVGRFASKFRSRRKHLPPDLARALIETWDGAARELGPKQRARSYWEALPYDPPLRDTNRRATYEQLLLDASEELVGHPPKDCGPLKPRGRS